MKTIYKSIALEAALLSVTLALQAEIQSGGETVTADVQASSLDRLKVTLVSPNVSGARDLVASGNAVIEGSEISVNLENLTFGTHRLVASARFGTQIRTLYALDISVPQAELPNETQEYEDAAIVVSTYGDGGGGEFPTDYAKQGDDPTATLTDAQAYAQAAAEAAQSLTSLDSDINAGKQAIAAAITSKGVSGITPQATLVEMANGVMQIAQQPIEIDGGDMYAEQLTGDGTLWDLYQVLAQMKNRFINASYEHGGQTYNFDALIVCEYYKGYDSLQLQGADCYFTCDGDFYDYASPNHVWHDSDNGKANRWVCFLYAHSGSRLDVTNTAISPRSMYIGGHIGTIEYFVDGRLTDIVCGVEETDVIDNFISTGYAQQWQFNAMIRNIRRIGKNLQLQSAGTILIDNLSDEQLNYASGEWMIEANNAGCIVINGCKKLVTNFSYSALVKTHKDIVMVSIQSLESVNGNILYLNNATARLQEVDVPNLKEAISQTQSLFYLYGATVNDLIKFKVGAMETDLPLKGWNPTNVLSDPIKTAMLIDNIKHHILARVSDATGGTQLVFTVSTNMYNAIASEMITWQDQTMTLADAFLTKNWLLAGA